MHKFIQGTTTTISPDNQTAASDAASITSNDAISQPEAAFEIAKPARNTADVAARPIIDVVRHCQPLRAIRGAPESGAGARVGGVLVELAARAGIRRFERRRR